MKFGTLLHVAGVCPGWSGDRFLEGECYACWKRRNPATKGAPRRIVSTSPGMLDFRMQGIVVDPGGVYTKLPKPLPRGRCVYLGPMLHKCSGELFHTHECNLLQRSCKRGETCVNCDHHDDGGEMTYHPSTSVARWKRDARERVVRKAPPGWCSWPVAKRTFLELAADYIRSSDPVCPPRSGRGIVTCGGGKYEASVYVCVRTLRHVGCTLPVEVWHDGTTEPLSDKVRSLPGVTVHDLATLGLRISSGWAAKSAALTHTNLAEVMFIDADAYPVTLPDVCFDHNPTGCVVFPDRQPNQGWRDKIHWKSYGVTDEVRGRAPPSISGGHYVLDIAKCWRALKLAFHFDQHSEFWYCNHLGVGGFGDQDQMRAALTITDTKWHLYSYRCEYIPRIFLFRGPDKEALFVHRAGCKFALPGQFRKPPQRFPHLPLEDVVWEFFEEWKR